MSDREEILTKERVEGYLRACELTDNVNAMQARLCRDWLALRARVEVLEEEGDRLRGELVADREMLRQHIADPEGSSPDLLGRLVQRMGRHLPGKKPISNDEFLAAAAPPASEDPS